MMDLYEFVGELEWIKSLVHEYNEMGFETYTSQPGSISNNYVVYKSVYDRKNKGEIISRNGCRKQRAYIKGYMNINMANYIIDKLKNDKYLFVRSTNHNGILDDEIKLGSVIFLDDKPIIYEMSKLDDIREIPDADESYNFVLPLRIPNDKENIVEFDILDKRWNDNSYLWTRLYSLI